MFSDLLTDTLLPLSSKMKDSSYTQGSSLCLMNASRNIHPLDTENLVNFIFGSSVVPHKFDLHKSEKRTKFESPFIKNIVCSSLRHSFLSFSPHIYSFVNDSIRFYKSQSQMLICPAFGLNMLRDLPVIDPVAEKPQTLDTNSKKTDISVVSEPKLKLSVTIKNSSIAAESNMVNNKFNVPNNVTLTLELSNRKTRELQKRSKKRRRRQKSNRTNSSISASGLKNKVDSCMPSSRISNHESCVKNSKSKNEFGVSASPNIVSSFVISVGDLSDSDSDWDCSGENDILTEMEDFEFGGLVVTNLNSSKLCFYPPVSPDVTCKFSTFYKDDETDEMARFEAVLLEVNKKWNEATKEVDSNPKPPSKVSFASDDQLVEILPVDFCERKGEWGIYAVERIRFKKRIDELEKIISPCLAVAHRLAFYEQYLKPRL